MSTIRRIGRVGTMPNQNLQLLRGDRHILTFRVLDQNGSPFGWRMARQRGDRFAVTPVVTKALGDGITVDDAAGGVLSVTLLPADTAGLSGAFYHELETGNGEALATGILTISQDLIA